VQPICLVVKEEMWETKKNEGFLQMSDLRARECKGADRYSLIDNPVGRQFRERPIE
jgi:hypothetical protein